MTTAKAIFCVALLALTGCESKKRDAVEQQAQAVEKATIIPREEMKLIGDHYLFWVKECFSDQQAVWRARRDLAEANTHGSALLAQKDLADAEKTLSESFAKKDAALKELPIRGIPDVEFEGPDWFSIIGNYSEAVQNSMIENRRDVMDGDWRERQDEWYRLLSLKLDQIEELYAEAQ